MRRPVIDPDRGSVIGDAAVASVDDHTDATESAAPVPPRWRTTPPRQRSEVLARALSPWPSLIRASGSGIADREQQRAGRRP